MKHKVHSEQFFKNWKQHNTLTAYRAYWSIAIEKELRKMWDAGEKLQKFISQDWRLIMFNDKQISVRLVILKLSQKLLDESS